jgi:hypothetical protein
MCSALFHTPHSLLCVLPVLTGVPLPLSYIESKTKTPDSAMSKKASKKAALSALKSARLSGLARFNDDDDSVGSGRHKSNLDTVQFADPDDVYENLTEGEYR